MPTPVERGTMHWTNERIQETKHSHYVDKNKDLVHNKKDGTVRVGRGKV